MGIIGTYWQVDEDESEERRRNKLFLYHPPAAAVYQRKQVLLIAGFARTFLCCFIHRGRSGGGRAKWGAINYGENVWFLAIDFLQALINFFVPLISSSFFVLLGFCREITADKIHWKKLN